MLASRALGEGRPLLMLHGWGVSGEALVPLATLLSEEAQVHVLDLPGFGKSPPPQTAWGIGEYAYSVLEYMDAAGLSKVDLFGHSFGGRIAIYLASHHPERVGRLVLMGSAGIPPRRSLRRRAFIFWLSALRTLIKLTEPFLGPRHMEWYRNRFGSPDYKNAGVLRPTLVRVIGEDLSPHLPAIACPTLLVWGALDTETPLEMGERFHRSIANSKLVVLPQSGHFPYADGAQMSAYHIRNFLQGAA